MSEADDPEDRERVDHPNPETDVPHEGEGMPGPGPEERPHPTGRRNAQGIRIDPEAAAEPPVRRATISALVKHDPGVLARVAGLFSRRQFNIEGLTVGPVEDGEHARITLVVEEHDPGVEQAKKQLRKLVPVVAVHELDPDAIERELALIKVDGDAPDEVGAVAEMYDARTVDACPDSITVEVTGSTAKIEGAIEAFEQFGIREVCRTGAAALERGTLTTTEF
jgi:acetolactate synthase-1/3 small subunit